MLLKLHSVVVHCSDMKRSLAFYRDQLGIPVKSESPQRSELHFGPVPLALEIARPSGRQSREPEAGQASLSLEVLDLEKFYQEKTARGVEFSLPPAAEESGAKTAVLVDPDGLRITVREEIR